MNLPEEFSAYTRALLGSDFDRFQASLTEAPPVSIRLNPAKPFTPAFKLDSPIPWCSNAYYLESRPVFTLDPAFHAGGYYVQEASSMVIEHLFKEHAPKDRPLKVLDLCAAPGGKSTLLASLLSPNDLLVANEVIKSRVGILKENLLKWGYPNVIIAQQDPETFSDLEGFFDVVLVDAPCSGEGLFRKTPDATSEWSMENVQMCAARQRRILSAAAMLVAPDGLLLYSTCTYNAFENQQNANWLTRTLDLVSIDVEVPDAWGGTKAEPGLQFFPHRTKGEGFYVAAFRNKSRDVRYVQGKPSLPRVPQRKVIQLSAWLEYPSEFAYYLKNDGVVVAIRHEILEATGSVLRALQKRSNGLELGHFKGDDFIPSHALALSTCVSTKLPRVELSEKQALHYLKKEPLRIDDQPSGWALCTYQGLALGWMKVIGTRTNNYLPTEWRIRMQVDS